MTSEVEQRPMLITAGYRYTAITGLTKKPRIQIFGIPRIVELALDRFPRFITYCKDASFKKVGHLISPLTPGAFCEKCIF